MTAREVLHALVDRLADADVAEVLDYVHWLQSPGDTLSDEELAQVREGEAEIARGEYMTLADLTGCLGE